MAEQYILFVVIAPVAILLCAGILFYAYQHRSTPGSKSLSYLLVSVTGWLIFNTLELISPNPEKTFMWAVLTYPFIATTPYLWLTFALDYTGRKSWLKPVPMLLLGVIPLITGVLGLTSAHHTLIWQSTSYVSIQPFLALEVVHGTWFWVHIAYSYLAVFVGSFLIVQESIQSHFFYRRQSLWLAIGGILPVLLNIIYLSNLIPLLNKDYTPVGFALSGLLLGVGILYYRLFDLRPVARSMVVDRMNDGVIIIDELLRVVDINPAAQRILGREADRIIGMPVADVSQNVPELLNQLENESATPTALLAVSGEHQRAFDLKIAPLCTPDDRQYGRVVVMHDITERQQIEVMLRKHTRALEKRTAELDAFSHTVAHGLKNPLGTLLGFTYMLNESLQTPLDDSVQTLLNGITASAESMDRIVESILLLNSVARREDALIDGVDIALTVGEALDRTEILRAEAHADISQSELWPVVMGFQPWIEELWVNYLTNALKYGGDPDHAIPPRIELGWQVDTEPGMLRFYVRDNGPGLTEEQQSRVFTEFTRLQKVQGEGYGLGLSIVLQITEKLGGRCGVYCPPEGGSIFWFTLPEKYT